MRLFLAIDLPADIRRVLSTVRELAISHDAQSDWHAHPVTWVRPENLHVTLKFLGEVPEAALPQLRGVLEQVPRAGPLALTTEGFQFFPDRGPIRVIAAKIGGDDVGRLALLQRSLEDACEDLGYKREGRAFRPHVTLARSRDGLPAHVRPVFVDRRKSGWFLHDYPGLREPLDAAFAATEFVLVQSQLLPAGPVYTPVATFPL